MAWQRTRADTALGYGDALFFASRHMPPVSLCQCAALSYYVPPLANHRLQWSWSAAAHRRAPTQCSSSLTKRRANIASVESYIYQKMLGRIHIQNMYGLDPFSAQNAANDNPAHPPSIFGALPYPRSSAVDPPLHTLVTFRFTSIVVLDCTVVGPTNEPYYRLASAVSAQGLPFTLLKTAAGRNIALVEWQSHPTVEAQSVGPKQHVAQWLRLSSDRRSRTMIHGGVYYSWAPLDQFLHLFAPGSSEWLVRITKIYDTVVLELTHRAIELGLIDVAVLATALLQCGKNID